MPRTGWGVPTFPFPPIEPPGLTEVPDAFLTRVRRGDLRTVEDRPSRWLQGAVYDADLRLVVESQKLSGLPAVPMVVADPAQVAGHPRARTLEGTWLYGGHWIQHFGHFFTETLTTLWPEGLAVDGLVFHSFLRRFSGVRPWQKQLLELTEYAGLPVEIIDTAPLRVERLHVPGRAVVLNGWGHPPAHRVWQSMAARAGAATTYDPDGERVFLSRTSYNRNFRERGNTKRLRTDAQHDAELDRVFADAGFRVVAPEELSASEQVRLAASASVLVGASGSALHLSAFAPAGLRVVELGDRRSPTEQTPMQRIVDRLADHPTAFVPVDVTPAQLPGVLEELGLTGSSDSPGRLGP